MREKGNRGRKDIEQEQRQREGDIETGTERDGERT